MTGRSLPVAAIRELTEIVPIGLSSRQVARIVAWGAKLVDDALSEAAAAAESAPTVQRPQGAMKDSALVADQSAARGGVTGPAPADHGNGKAQEVPADLTRNAGERAEPPKPAAEPAVKAAAVAQNAAPAVPVQAQPVPPSAAAPVPPPPAATVTPGKESELARIARRIVIPIDGPPRPLVVELMQHLAQFDHDFVFTPTDHLILLIDLAAGESPQSIGAALGHTPAAITARFRDMLTPRILDRFGHLTLGGRAALLEAAKRNAVAS